jgi:hypothetical protein
MRWPRFAVVVVLGAVIVGCGSDEPEATPGQPAAGEDTAAAPTAAEDTAAAPAVAEPEPPPPTAAAMPAMPAADEPWTPERTGTVDPGMTRDQVIGVWGEPVAESTSGSRTYLYFRNGCEVSCGTFDVVFLEGGQVVDAIVRGEGHMYSGVSSSPPGREALPTLPGATGAPE